MSGANGSIFKVRISAAATMAASVAAAFAMSVATPAYAAESARVVEAAVRVWSVAPDDDKLEAVLSFVFKNEALRFGWPANYRALWCPTNVFNLLKRLDQAHVDLSRATVWYILPTPDGSGGVIRPRVARPADDGRAVTEWSFHVILEIEGRILDLDFTSQPDVVSVPTYAASMWEKGPLAPVPDAEPLYVRRIPALEYLAQYANNWSFYEEGGGGRYPAVEISTLIRSAAPVHRAPASPTFGQTRESLNLPMIP